MANMNRKSVPEDELEKMQEGSKKAKEKNSKDKLAIKQAEKQLFDKSKENLPQLLEQRLNELETVLEKELMDINGLKAPRIHSLISRQSIANTTSMVGYSPKELFIVYQAYQQLVEKINEFTMYIPSIKSFCAFAGFSSMTYDNWKTSPDEEKRNVIRMVDDYISDVALDAGAMRKADASVTIFRAKSEHGMTEAVNPQSIPLANKVDFDSINRLINNIKDGKVVDAEFKEKP